MQRWWSNALYQPHNELVTTPPLKNILCSISLEIFVQNWSCAPGRGRCRRRWRRLVFEEHQLENSFTKEIAKQHEKTMNYSAAHILVNWNNFTCMELITPYQMSKRKVFFCRKKLWKFQLTFGDLYPCLGWQDERQGCCKTPQNYMYVVVVARIHHNYPCAWTQMWQGLQGLQ